MQTDSDVDCTLSSLRETVSKYISEGINKKPQDQQSNNANGILRRQHREREIGKLCINKINNATVNNFWMLSIFFLSMDSIDISKYMDFWRESKTIPAAVSCNQT